MELFSDIMLNIVLLFGLVSIINLFNKTIEKRQVYVKILNGVVIGVVTILIMMNGWTFEPGAMFDTRSVIIGLSALFFSWITSSIALVMAIIYRVVIGGIGLYAGVLMLLSAFFIGLIWKKVALGKLPFNNYLSFYLFGLVVHIAVILSIFAFPYPENIDIFLRVAPVIIIVFPIALMLLAILYLNNQKRLINQTRLKKSEERYRTLVTNSKFGIIQYNTSGVIELANQAFADILETKREHLIGLDMTKLKDKALIKKLKESLNGHVTTYEDHYESELSHKRLLAKVRFSPLYDNNQVVGGIGIIEDLSEKQALEENIERLRQKDILTNTLNRASFDEFLFLNKPGEGRPITIAACGVNSFKVINYTFGYDVGNQVLKTIANVLLGFSKGNDNLSVYRIGGDEFALVMLNTNRQEAAKLTRKIKRKIIKIDTFGFDLGISCGLSTSTTDEPLSETLNRALSDMSTNKVYDGSSITMKTIDLVMSTLFEKSQRESLHSNRVSTLSKKIAERLGRDEAFIARTEMAGKLHDIGKINVSEEILNKPNRLEEHEWHKIKVHPETGYKILASVPEYLELANIVYTHHEKWDGSGYPRGLSKEEIPFEARIIAVADAFDAMTKDRTYRNALTREEALNEIKKHSGTQFEPDVVDVFLNDVMEEKSEGASNVA